MRNLFDLIIYVAAILGAAATITGFIVKWLDKKLNDIINPLKIQIHKMDVKECRRFLIDFLIDVENGKGSHTLMLDSGTVKENNLRFNIIKSS